jgi:hypothetical protein
MKLTDDLLAQVFNPDKLLRELAAIQVSRIDPLGFENVIRRLPQEMQARLIKQVQDVKEGRGDMIWDRFKFLYENEYLDGLPSPVLYELTLEMEPVHLGADQAYDLAGKGIEAKMGIVRSGEITLVAGDQELGNLASNEIAGIPSMMVTEKSTLKVASPSGASLLVAVQDRIDELMFDHEELAQAMYRWVGEQQNKWKNLSEEMVS